MKNIASFNIDNTKLLRGIYVSRKDVIEGGGMITVFDIRMKLPNREPALSLSALHTIEHLANHFLRNHPVWGSKIVYWGPKGCCTGNNLIIEGDLESSDIVPLMHELFTYIAAFDEDIPRANAVDCGNYMLNNLPMAKWEARKFLVEVLNNAQQVENKE